MKPLPAPEVDFIEALSQAIAGIGRLDDREAHRVSFVDAAAMEADYSHRARVATLCLLPRIVGREDPIVLGSLRKSNLMALYDRQFVGKDKPARRLYEEIKVSANGKCPLCGGIGHVRTLDHYLPKANFPVYSVLPANLIPCCRDCNSEKLNRFPHVIDQQTIHPYFDNRRFFMEKWVHAKVLKSKPPVVEFFVKPPDEWPVSDKRRVSAHFAEYRLAERFSVEAAGDLPEVIRTRQGFLSRISAEEYSLYLAEQGDSDRLPVNNWRRVMFTALAGDRWFCEQEFNDG